jgi:hypothetical protein
MPYEETHRKINSGIQWFKFEGLHANNQKGYII